jgi:hypothetical protein
MSETRQIIARYEAKYLVSDETARAIAAGIRGICSPDRFAGSDGRYIVNNVYFETPELRFYYDTKHRRPERFKPRIRYYGDGGHDHLWLELKHKLNNVTWKVRRRIDADAWPNVLHGNGATGAERPGRRSLTDSFEEAVTRFQARPILHVRYVREAYVSDIDRYGRVTFDRRLSVAPMHRVMELGTDGDRLYYDDPISARYELDGSPVVLEIKSETQVPQWMANLIRILGSIPTT